MRSSHFSLDFPVISPTNSGEARSKVGLRCKGYVWVPVCGVSTTPRGRFFFYLDILYLKGHENGFRCCEVGNCHGFWFHRSGTDA